MSLSFIKMERLVLWNVKASTWVTCQMSNLIGISEEFMFPCKVPNGCRNESDKARNSLELGEWRGPEKYLGPKCFLKGDVFPWGKYQPIQKE